MSHKNRDAVKDKAEAAARKKLDEMYKAFEEAKNHAWLKMAYITDQGTIAFLRDLIRELRDIFACQLAVHVQQLTVAEAQLWDVCRICKRRPGAAEVNGTLVLDYGNEYAHRCCLQISQFTDDELRSELRRREDAAS